MDFDNNKPIYIQIIDDIKRKLIRGEIKPGDKILSQREFAKEINVNPNTVQRAYREMEAMGLVETLRGQGTFILGDENMLKTIQTEMAKEMVTNFLKDMKSLGFSQEDIISLITVYMKEEK